MGVWSAFRLGWTAPQVAAVEGRDPGGDADIVRLVAWRLEPAIPDRTRRLRATVEAVNLVKNGSTVADAVAAVLAG